jgi:hypothetical protein
MKKLILLSLVALTTFTAEAQRKKTRANTSQGMFALRLGIGVSSNTINNDDLTVGDESQLGVGLNPSIGYFVADNLELGINGSFGYNRTKVTYSTTPVTSSTRSNNLSGFGVYVQKYWPMNNWFAFYGNVNAGLNFGNSETTAVPSLTTPIGSSINGYGGALNFGFAFTPVHNVALMADIAGVGVQSITTDPTGPNNQQSVTSIGVSSWRNPYNLTFVWFFGNAKED